MGKVVPLFKKDGPQIELVEKLEEIITLAKEGYFTNFVFAGQRVTDGDVTTAFAQADPPKRTELIAHMQVEVVSDMIETIYVVERR
ncbi:MULTISPECIES: hypothetical protein [Pelosinus]|uniref:Uncharacterized protein n=1 Tax=Pelosinus fermentans B4 TaxID=1149862 RepID=I9LHF0_9FIRM|nr:MULTISPECIES: hypothetical protein [Pelosinus]EIW19934.1 hypothetical protein FB4_0185 [Pelosinus fermentans B4]EIW21209.1 hypothetical protein FA11_0936 [Pelosinus fermentans A11]